VTTPGQRGRAAAVSAAHGTCPRCGAARGPDDRFCLDCGAALPEVTGRRAALRRGWIRRLGWYPGDWMWPSLVALLVAIGGAAVAIAVTERGEPTANAVFNVPATVSVRSPTPVTTPATTAATRATGTLPTPSEPGTAAARNGRLAWPQNENGWTVVLTSYPKDSGRPAALATADKAAKGLQRVGILDSGGFASLQPGYLVVFAGIYPSQADADAAVPTARQAGFRAAYTRQISR
jgi:hypothetical protein